MHFWCIFCGRFILLTPQCGEPPIKSFNCYPGHNILSLFLYLGYIDVDQWVKWVSQLPEDEITKLIKFTILPAEMGRQTPNSRWEINLMHAGVLFRVERRGRGKTNEPFLHSINNGIELKSRWTKIQKMYKNVHLNLALVLLLKPTEVKYGNGKTEWLWDWFCCPCLTICRKVFL